MQKHVNLVDLVKSFPTNIYLQNLASIQPRASHLIFIILATSRDSIFTERSSPRYEKLKWADPKGVEPKVQFANSGKVPIIPLEQFLVPPSPHSSAFSSARRSQTRSSTSTYWKVFVFCSASVRRNPKAVYFPPLFQRHSSGAKKNESKIPC